MFPGIFVRYQKSSVSHANFELVIAMSVTREFQYQGVRQWVVLQYFESTLDTSQVHDQCDRFKQSIKQYNKLPDEAVLPP